MTKAILLVIAVLLCSGVLSTKIALTDSTNTTQYLGVYSNRILSWWPPSSLAVYLGIPGYVTTNYNVFILTFWLSTGASDTALVWSDPINYFSTDNPFGSTKEEVQDNILARYHGAGMKVLISAFGATEFPVTSNLDPVTTCTNLAQFVLDNKADGVDLDYEDSNSFESATAHGEDWLITCTKTLRQYLPQGQYILTHAPQAPYFIGNASIYPNGAYLKVHQEVGDLIDYYNVQFYNQGSLTKYDSYATLFQSSGGDWPNTAVNQIIASGVPKEKIVIGKPASAGDATNTGLVAASDLGTWAKQGRADSGWNTGIFTWQFSSDISGNFINSYISANK